MASSGEKQVPEWEAFEQGTFVSHMVSFGKKIRGPLKIKQIQILAFTGTKDGEELRLHDITLFHLPMA